MLNKLAVRNVKRSLKDYLIYIATMTIISALVFAFNGMMFSEDLQEMTQGLDILVLMTVLASIFIFFLVIWLVRYISNFMVQRRSNEFAIYLLVGIEKRQIASIFRMENLLLGGFSFLLGILPGVLLQWVFLNIYSALVDLPHNITIGLNFSGLVLTGVMLGVSYIIALFSISHRFKKMTIKSLINMQKQNEKGAGGKSSLSKIFLYIAVAYIIAFNVGLISGVSSDFLGWLGAGLVVSIYLLYIGLSSFFLSFIEKKHKVIFKGSNIFVLRQLSSKVKTMRFTMGTLTNLFTLALFGLTFAMMFTGFQREALDRNLVVDVLVFSQNTEEDFAPQLSIISDNASIREQHIYRIYTNRDDGINRHLYANVPQAHEGVSYHTYDTFMRLSDYNAFLAMTGLDAVILSENGFLFNALHRVVPHLEQFAADHPLQLGGVELTLQEVRTDYITQNGMNGADYIVVVPDELIAFLYPFYSMLAINLHETAPSNLTELLLEVQPDIVGAVSGGGILSMQMAGLEQNLPAIGSSGIISYGVESVIVRANANASMGNLMASFIFVLGYISFIFACIALTVLAVQQLSDATRFKFRYALLSKLGLSKKETNRVLLQQLGVYYVCPFIISVALTMVVGLFASRQFVYLSNVEVPAFFYYFLALSAFTVVYVIYFLVTYVGFRRSLNDQKR